MIREEARKACERLVRADAAMNSVEEAEELSRKKRVARLGRQGYGLGRAPLHATAGRHSAISAS